MHLIIKYQVRLSDNDDLTGPGECLAHNHRSCTAQVEGWVMDKLDQLLVRACKTKDPIKRLYTLRRRFYLSCATDTVLIVRLAGICDDFLRLQVLDVLEGLSPDRSLVEKNKDYKTRCLEFLILKIRMSDVKKFPGLSIPKKFKS